MNKNISLAFDRCKKENRPALLSYTVAGDNSKTKSIEILKSISKYIDICEIGFAHNTPIADGGQIQTSTHRALKNGIKINDVFQIIKKFKNNKKSKPIILMGYYNIVFQLGENKFINNLTTNKKYDLIIMDNVLEHIEEPNKVLKKIKKLMRKDSMLYIAVPDVFKYKKNLLFTWFCFYHFFFLYFLLYWKPK